MQDAFEKIISKINEKIEHYDSRHKILTDSGMFSDADRIAERMAELDFAKEIVKQEAEKHDNGWISCSERLPETNESVLCWAKSTARGGDVCFVGSCHNGFWFLQSSADTHSFPGQYVIVAWQPLPEPYQTNICDASDCPFNDGMECPAAEGCAGYEPKGE